MGTWKGNQWIEDFPVSFTNKNKYFENSWNDKITEMSGIKVWLEAENGEYNYNRATWWQKLWEQKYSASWLYQHQYSSCDCDPVLVEVLKDINIWRNWEKGKELSFISNDTYEYKLYQNNKFIC